MKRKVLMIGVLTAVLPTAVAAGITIARLQSGTMPLTNTFQPGRITTEIREEGDGAVKKSSILNIGENDCLVRARVIISPSEAAEAIELTGKDALWDWSNWSNGDGYVYYSAVLPAKTGDADVSCTSCLFEGVKLKNGKEWSLLGIETFEVTVYEEAVQTQAYAGGKMISALDENGSYDTEKAAEVWKIYETQEK